MSTNEQTDLGVTFPKENPPLLNMLKKSSCKLVPHLVKTMCCFFPAPVRMSFSLVTSRAKICPYVSTFLRFACKSMPISAFKTKILEVTKKAKLGIQQSPALKKK